MTHLKTEEPAKAGPNEYMTQIMRQVQYASLISRRKVRSFCFNGLFVFSTISVATDV
jgi:hypothetical protein